MMLGLQPGEKVAVSFDIQWPDVPKGAYDNVPLFFIGYRTKYGSTFAATPEDLCPIFAETTKNGKQSKKYYKDVPTYFYLIKEVKREPGERMNPKHVQQLEAAEQTIDQIARDEFNQLVLEKINNGPQNIPFDPEKSFVATNVTPKAIRRGKATSVYIENGQVLLTINGSEYINPRGESYTIKRNERKPSSVSFGVAALAALNEALKYPYDPGQPTAGAGVPPVGSGPKMTFAEFKEKWSKQNACDMTEETAREMIDDSYAVREAAGFRDTFRGSDYNSYLHGQPFTVIARAPYELMINDEAFSSLIHIRWLVRINGHDHYCYPDEICNEMNK